MSAEQLRKFRQRNNWTQKQMAEMLSTALDRRYDGNRIGDWERGKVKLPEHVSLFLTELGLEQMLPDRSGETPGGETLPPPGEDSAPGDAPSPERDGKPLGQQPLTSFSGTYARVCTEMWELVATAVGMVGAVTGSEQLQRDGLIIEADKEALGRAYGKLAESNETFRRMLTGMTTSGAWLEVALTTGITAGKVMRNHQSAAKPVDGPEGDGGDVLAFPQTG